MARKSILQAIRSARYPSESSFAANNNAQQTSEPQQISEPVIQAPIKEKIKRIVVDVPEEDHIKIKVFATQHGISIKQLVLIALQDAMQDNE